ncbi:hypothetical protein MTHERMMSTA1_00470 [Methanosarcina thermophila MST-A1]|jgi:hypothetical protein|uniref:Uncharacterized protein n=2 Tax=Methanosarcina thermophila TaxID=2210 RepID=A0A3G9CR14_METTE|nr:predicted protein [Methanosarcina thermophila]GLI12921.1 hypothetical protein MTHERMMSTA1_00470 [Methanosarcina thermophila MST-A1]
MDERKNKHIKKDYSDEFKGGRALREPKNAEAFINKFSNFTVNILTIILIALYSFFG